MKLNRVQIVSNIWLLIRLCVPVTVFIVVCTGLLLPFDGLLLWLDQVAPNLIGLAWLSLLIIYIVGGVALIRLVAGLLRRFFGSEEVRVQERMVFLSGVPFYVSCLLFFLVGLFELFDPNTGAGAAFFSLVGFFAFCLITVIYLYLTGSFLKLPRPSLFRKRLKIG
jgi:hypothetical protein